MSLLQAGVEVDEEIDGVDRLARACSATIGVERGPGRLAFEIGGELGRQLGRIDEGEAVGLRLDEEVERVEHRELGQEVDRRSRTRSVFSGKDEARQPVAVRVLLPVHEVGLGRPPSANRRGSCVRQCGAGRSRMSCGPRRDGPVVDVTGDVMKSRKDRHAGKVKAKSLCGQSLVGCGAPSVSRDLSSGRYPALLAGPAGGRPALILLRPLRGSSVTARRTSPRTPAQAGWRRCSPRGTGRRRACRRRR